MNTLQKSQAGSALFVSLIILALLAILGTSTMTGSITGLRIANNTSQVVESFQNAEAGVNATMSLVGTTNDPFNGSDSSDPFSNISVSESPLYGIGDVSVSTALVEEAGTCARSQQGWSNNQINCEYYRVDSVHSASGTGVATSVHQGVRRQVIAN
jgi:Tfp pilus assembly protein PilX